MGLREENEKAASKNKSDSSDIKSKSKKKKKTSIIEIGSTESDQKMSDNDMPPTPSGSDKENQSGKTIKKEKQDHPFFKNTKRAMRRKKTGEDDGSSVDSMAEDMKKAKTATKSKKKKKKSKSDSDSDSDCKVVKEKKPRRKKGEQLLPSFKKRKPLGRTKKLRKQRKKKERKIMSRDALREDTKQAIEQEESRASRIKKLREETLKLKKKEKEENNSDYESDDEMVYLDCQ